MNLSHKFPRVVKPLAGLLLAAFVLLAPLPRPNSQPADHYYRIEASRFTFAPAVLRVQPGDRVTIDLVATDVVHGIYIDEYALQASADPGQTARLTFIASKPGMVRFRCLIPCGQLHPFMIGKILIGENTLFLRAVVLALLSFVLLIPWKTPKFSASI